jgi:hypothetical protein
MFEKKGRRLVNLSNLTPERAVCPPATDHSIPS